MQVKRDYETEHGITLLTAGQAGKIGLQPSAGAEPVKLWSNGFYSNSFCYYRPDQLEPMNPEQREAFREAARAKRRLPEGEKERRRVFRQQRREIMKEPAGKPIRNPSRIICLDTETTGINPERDEILQLAIVDGEGRTLFNHHFHPIWFRQWQAAEQINQISPAKAMRCCPMLHYAGQIKAILASADTVICYNAGFDLPLLINAGFTPPEGVIDIMIDYARIVGEWSDFHGDYKWHKLSECAAHYGYQWQGRAHDALEDCRATLHCYNAIYGRQEGRGTS